ncbi:MAG: DUF1592 domain-containing protein [Pirellulales bacterium]|nr:DUF1592 domain-containing protein [Pirellulales bacterium]
MSAEGPTNVAKHGKSYQQQVRPLLMKYCSQCHGPNEQEARIRFDQIDVASYAEKQHLWTTVHRLLSDGEMPPEDEPHPTDAERKLLLEWIEKQQRALGNGSTRRLNRREFVAALNDVTGLKVDWTHLLPEDGTLSGFDTGASTLTESTPAMAQLMSVSRQAVEGIRFLEPAEDTRREVGLRGVKTANHIKAFEGWDHDLINRIRPDLNGAGLALPPGFVAGNAGLTTSQDHKLRLRFLPPADKQAILRMEFTLSRLKSTKYRTLPNPSLWLSLAERQVDFREVTADADKPHRYVYEFFISDENILFGKVIQFQLLNVYGTPSSSSAPYGMYKSNTPYLDQPVPYLVLHDIAADTDYVAAWPPAHWNVDVGTITDSDESAHKLLSLFLRRAWRRPVDDDEHEPFLMLYRSRRKLGESFDDALRATFQAVLLSGSFRHLSSTLDKEHGQYHIASRLSFLLQGTPPDEQLLNLAKAGKLRDAAVLDAQVDRLIEDSRSQAFVRPFVRQWLQMDQPLTVYENSTKTGISSFFSTHLKESMREETYSYVQQVLQDNLSARELIASDWTMMNDVLSRHYQYEGIHGYHMRKVKLRADDPRGGGILGHAGIQSMLAWMGDNWVIYRGAWTLRNILDAPPPPPPVEIPELTLAKKENQGKTFKELLRQHQNDQRCSICHKDIDPLGFAFQNFDISGLWREVEHDSYQLRLVKSKVYWSGVGKVRSVDSVGHLPRGEEFSSFLEFRDLVAEHYLDDFVRGLAKNFVIYATGRRPNVGDMNTVREILRRHAAKGYPLRSVLKDIVKSEIFLNN